MSIRGGTVRGSGKDSARRRAVAHKASERRLTSKSSTQSSDIALFMRPIQPPSLRRTNPKRPLGADSYKGA